MNCHECREELELWVGMSELPPPLQEHISSCAECRSYWNELNGLALAIGDDRSFDVTIDERASILRGINNRTVIAQTTVVTPLSWLRYVAVAASVLIVAGIGITGYRAQWFGEHASLTDTTVIAQVDTQTRDNMKADETLVLDEDDYSIFETAIDSTVSFDDEDLLENLSDEQIQYLESNLDVRGLI